MRMRPIIIVALIAGGCASPKGPGDLIDARWRLKPGDSLSIQVRVDQNEGSDPTMEVDALFRVREVAADGASLGTVEVGRMAMRSAGETPMSFIYERGVVSEARGMPEEQTRGMTAKLRQSTESKLSPGGLLTPVRPADAAYFASWPLGCALPGRTLRGSDSWRGMVRAAYSDVLETEYRFETFAERMCVTGRSTPQAEEKHKIRVSAKGTFLSAEGIVSEGVLDIDFSPLGMNRKTTVRFSISRR